MDMNRDKNGKQELLYKTLYSYIGYNHVENINAKINESVEDIDSVQVPESLDKWFANFNRNLENKKRKDKYRSIFNNIMPKVAIVLVILFISTAVLTVSVEAFRIKLFNMIIENTDRYLDIQVQEQSNIQGTIDNKNGYNEPKYVPAGFQIDEITDLGTTKIISYTNHNNEEILFQKAPNGSSFQLDSEDAIIVELDIMGTDVIMLSKEGMNTLFWHNEEYSFYLLSTIEQEELISMIESMIGK